MTKVKQVAAKAKAALKKRIDELPLRFDAGECGKPGGPGTRAHVRCLERLKLRAPPLPFDLEVGWKNMRDAYAEAPLLRNVYLLKAKGSTVGPDFIKQINGVLEKLCQHYKGPTKYNVKGEKGGDETAFLCFVQKMAKATAPKMRATVAVM